MTTRSGIAKRAPSLVGILAAALVFSAASADAAAPPAAPDAPAPRLVVAPPSHDFGEIWAGETVTCSFELRNAGNADLKIVRVRRSCGSCTKTRMDQTPLKPGESRRLEVEFQVGARKGRTSKKVYVQTNDPKRPFMTLPFTATVKPSVEVTPSRADFGNIRLGSAGAKDLVLVRRRGAGPLKIARVSPSSQRISASVVSTSENGATVRVKVPTDSLTEISETLQVAFEDNALPPVKLSVRANVISRFDVTPGRLFLGLVKPGATVTRSVNILPVSAKNVTRLALPEVAAPQGVQWKLQRVGDRGYEARITWTPVKGATNLRCRLRLTAMSGDKVIEALDIPCYGIVAPG